VAPSPVAIVVACTRAVAGGSISDWGEGSDSSEEDASDPVATEEAAATRGAAGNGTPAAAASGGTITRVWAAGAGGADSDRGTWPATGRPTAMGVLPVDAEAESRPDIGVWVLDVVAVGVVTPLCCARSMNACATAADTGVSFTSSTLPVEWGAGQPAGGVDSAELTAGTGTEVGVAPGGKAGAAVRGAVPLCGADAGGEPLATLLPAASAVTTERASLGPSASGGNGAERAAVSPAAAATSAAAAAGVRALSLPAERVRCPPSGVGVKAVGRWWW